MRADQSGAAGDQGHGSGRRPVLAQWADDVAARARVLAIWCMDWPAVAAAAAAGLPATAPVVVTLANRVVACSASARAAGVRRGLRRREAQARCPQRARRRRRSRPRRALLRGRDGGGGRRRAAGGGAAAGSAGVVGPWGGPLLRVRAVGRGAARRRGGRGGGGVPGRHRRSAAHRGVRRPGGPHRRAREGRVVPVPRCRSGNSPPSPAWPHPGRDDLVDLLWRMGIRSIGQFAALSRTDVASRFGADAITAHRFARGEPTRGPSGREPPPDLDAVMNCDPPVDRVDAAAFAGRSLADELHRSLEAAGIGCTRLAIHAVTANGEELQRVWRCAEPLTEDATADRVRWQLDGWLNRRRSDRPDRADHRAAAASGGGGVGRRAAAAAVGILGDDDRLRARRALVRVQGLLGPESVQVPVLSGGRGPAERITFTAARRRAGAAGRSAPALAGATARAVADRAARRSGRAARCRRQPGAGDRPGAVLRRPGAAGRGRRTGRLSWWAGPWPVDERWWESGEDAARPGGRARVQVLLDGPGRRRGPCHAAVLPAAAVVPGGGVRMTSGQDSVRRARTGPPAR